MPLKCRPPIDRPDPIAIAWEQSPHNGPLPAQLQQSAASRAGAANAARGLTGKGKHVLAVCVSILAAFGMAFLSGCGQSAESQATQQAMADAATMPDMLYVIHAPAAGCPSDWRTIPKAFYEPNGSYRVGCITGTGKQGGAMDYLEPGETFPGVAAVWSLGGGVL